ncbi:uncharacterized protein LOC113290509 [Papaver somniferum]|uniref:uncharacterized protein LOC113290509 n=1 Tax=Papaver somniferum TaxID=3469 RepID=UPI000E703791|nr:uncharacterized protein LOC113290509 [Papaver somniferum]
MAYETFVQPAIPRFYGHYDHWSMLMENFIRSKEYWHLIEDGVNEPVNRVALLALTPENKSKLDKERLADLKLKNYLFQAIYRSILETILDKSSSKSIWDSMKKKYQGTGKVKRAHLQALRSDWEVLRMKVGESVSDYLARAMSIANKMRSHGEKMDDVVIIEKVLRSMTSKFDYVVCSIEESHDVDTLSIDQLTSSLMIHKKRVNQHETVEQALQLQHSNNGNSSKKKDKEKDDETEISLLMACHHQEEIDHRNDMWYLDTGSRNRRYQISSQKQHSTSHLKCNLLNVGQLLEKGYELTFKNGVCRIEDPKRGLVTQYSERSIVVMASSLWTSEFQGDSFLKESKWRAKKVLELVHTDICGLVTPLSNDNKRYFITFTDDFSRKTWVYFLNAKSEAFSVFKELKVLVEKDAGCLIKTLRSDRGGEYKSNEFADFCKKDGIKRKFTAAFTPQQNGVAERKNRTILNMVRSVLYTSGVPKNFWPEVVQWSVYVLNRSPTQSVINMTPIEAWSGEKPCVSHLRVFGCIAYAHVPDEKRKKLDDKGVKCVFLGYSDVSKAYKLFDPITEKIMTSRDVVFDETRFWNWKTNDVGEFIPVEDDFVGSTSPEIHTPVISPPSSPEPQHIATPNAPTEQGSPSSLPTSPESETSQPSVAASRPRRTINRPSWMEDYQLQVSGDDSSQIHLALFAGSDLVSLKMLFKIQNGL